MKKEYCDKCELNIICISRSDKLCHALKIVKELKTKIILLREQNDKLMKILTIALKMRGL